MTTNFKSIENGEEITFSFGKNMHGLSDEIAKIGELIQRRSNSYRVLLREAFIDELDDIYELKFVCFPVQQDLEEYILIRDFNWFGKKIPKGTIYKMYNESKDDFRCISNGNECPHWDLTFMTVRQNPEWFLKIR